MHLYIQTAAIAVIVGYFLGNFQSALLISRRVLHDDVRRHGSGNPGATNMTRSYGTKWGVCTFILDAGKCVLAVLLGRWMGQAWGLFPADPALSAAVTGYAAGSAAVLGHCYPVVYRFKGGKGSACNFAFMFATLFPAALATTAAAVVIYLFSKKISLVSLCAALLFTVLSAAVSGAHPYVWAFALFNLILIVIRHKSNIKRLLEGTESTIDY